MVAAGHFSAIGMQGLFPYPSLRTICCIRTGRVKKGEISGESGGSLVPGREHSRPSCPGGKSSPCSLPHGFKFSFSNSM
ncbi:MAG TPA: hypothetical protein PLE57_01325 [Methanoregulaceae archaeon]|nr:hypothetical protein [Methanoregulaceae archaeon]HQP82564.1 hypothetical protein [Methanoregulaceae archaeon]